MSPNKPWSIAIFEEQRPHLVSFCKKDVVPFIVDEDVKRIIIRAPVKSGKREICEYIAMRDYSLNNVRIHAFVSAWHRSADESQRDELKKHNMQVFSIRDKTVVENFIVWVDNNRDKNIIVHIDECDHGSGNKQLLSKVWKHIKKYENIKTILYSATPEEVLFSGELDDDKEYLDLLEDIRCEGVTCRYEPPKGYCGPATFLDNNLVKEAEPFFRKNKGNYCLTDQAKTIIKDMLENMKTDPRRNILVLRLSYFEGKNNKALYTFVSNILSFIELENFLIFVDKEDGIVKADGIISEKIKWSEKNYWKSKTTEYPMLFIMDQTSTRSTEWSCHDRVFATHDYRNNIIFSTVSQAQERVNHYFQKYNGFQPIRVYGHVNTFKLSSGKIDYDEYLKPNMWVKKKIHKENKYKISNKEDNTLHEEYNGEYSEEEANNILKDIGSYSEVTISSRIKGNIYEKNIYDSIFHSCDKDTFKEIQDNIIKPVFDVEIRNPFIESNKQGLENGKFKGFLREWKVFDYEKDIENCDVG